MTTMELRTSLLAEVSTLLDDNRLMSEAIRLLKSIPRPRCYEEQQPVSQAVAEPPCQYTAAEVGERVVAARKEIMDGECCTQEDLLKRYSL